MTGIPAAALTDMADLPDIADLLADTWRQRGTQPPADWLAQATHTLRVHVTQLLAHAQAQHADAITRAAQSGRDELTRLRITLRQELAALAADGHIEMDFANSLLRACGQPLLRRTYTVHINVAFAVRVNAEDDDSAYRAAEDALADAIPDGDEIVANWDDIRHDGIDPGAVDTTAR